MPFLSPILHRQITEGEGFILLMVLNKNRPNNNTNKSTYYQNVNRNLLRNVQSDKIVHYERCINKTIHGVVCTEPA